MSIEAMKKALEALENAAQCVQNNYCPDEMGHDWDEQIEALRRAIAEAEDNYQGSDAAKAAHMMDLYTALGLKWGDDPFAVIAKMRSIAEAEPSQSDIKQTSVSEVEPVAHHPWCASMTRMLTSMPPKKAPCDCKVQCTKHGECFGGECIYHEVEGVPNIDNNTKFSALYTTPQPKQEPVAFIAPNGDLRKTAEAKDASEWGAKFEPLYTNPQPKREWVGLTDEEILGLIGIHVDDINDIDDWQEEIREVRAIEAKLKEKNI